PLGPLGVADLDRDGTALRAAMTHPAEDAHLVLPELHARAAPVPQAAAGQCRADVVRGDLDTRRKPLEDAHERLAVGLTCRQPAHHGPHPPTHLARTPAPVRAADGGRVVISDGVWFRC